MARKTQPAPTPKRGRGRPRESTPTDPNSFAARLIHAREARHLTAEKAAERCGLAYRSWLRWEAGGTPPAIDTVVAICRGLGVSIVEITSEG